MIGLYENVIVKTCLSRLTIWLYDFAKSSQMGCIENEASINPTRVKLSSYSYKLGTLRNPWD